MLPSQLYLDLWFFTSVTHYYYHKRLASFSKYSHCLDVLSCVVRTAFHVGPRILPSQSSHVRTSRRNFGNSIFRMSSTTEELRVWNMKLNQPVGEPITFTEYTKHSELATSIGFSPDGKHIALGLNSSPQAVEIWNVDTKTRVAGPLKGHTDKINFVAFSPGDGKHLVSGSSDGTLRIWNLDTKQQAGPPVHTDRTHEEECNVALSPDGKHIVTAGRDHTIRVWDTDTGTQVGQPLLGHTHPVKSVAFSHDGKHIVSGSFDKTVRVWDLAHVQGSSLVLCTNRMYCIYNPFFLLLSIVLILFLNSIRTSSIRFSFAFYFAYCMYYCFLRSFLWDVNNVIILSFR